MLSTVHLELRFFLEHQLSILMCAESDIDHTLSRALRITFKPSNLSTSPFNIHLEQFRKLILFSVFHMQQIKGWVVYQKCFNRQPIKGFWMTLFNFTSLLKVSVYLDIWHRNSSEKQTHSHAVNSPNNKHLLSPKCLLCIFQTSHQGKSRTESTLISLVLTSGSWIFQSSLFSFVVYCYLLLSFLILLLPYVWWDYHIKPLLILKTISFSNNSSLNIYKQKPVSSCFCLQF